MTSVSHLIFLGLTDLDYLSGFQPEFQMWNPKLEWVQREAEEEQVDI